MNYYSHHIGDYLLDTAHLSILEDGVYRRLIDRYYTTEKPLAKDEAALFRIIRARTNEEKEATRLILDEFFDDTPGGWSHKRCNEEIELFQGKAEKNRVNGAKGGRPVKSSNPEITQVVSENNPEITLTKNQEPRTKNQEPSNSKTKAPPSALPAWLPSESWQAFAAMRKAIKKPLTPDAVPIAIRKLDALRAEGNDPRMVLEQSTMNSWQGLFEVKLEARARGSPGGKSSNFEQGQANAERAKKMIFGGGNETS